MYKRTAGSLAALLTRSTVNTMSRFISYEIQLEKLIKEGNTSQIVSVLKEAKGNTLTSQTFLHSLKAHFEENEITQAEHIFNNLKDYGDHKPSTEVYTTMINGFMFVKQIDTALTYLDDMKQKKIFPSIATFSVVMKGLLKTDRSAEAEILVSQMPTKGIKPDIQTYAVLIRHFCKNNNVQKVLEWYNRLRDDISPNETIYLPIIRLFLNMENTSASQTFYDANKDQIAIKGFLNTLLPHCPEPSTHTILSDTLQEMKLKKMKISTERKFTSATTHSDAMKYLDILKKKNEKLDLISVNTVINNFCSRPNDGEIIFKRLPEFQLTPDVFTYSTLIKGFFFVNDSTKAKQYYKEMKERGIMPNNATLTTLCTGLYKCGDMKEGKKILHELKKEHYPITIDFLQKILTSICDAGHREDALIFLDHMAEFKVKPDTKLFNKMIVSLSKHSPGVVERIIKEMKYHDISMDLKLFHTILDPLIRTRQIDLLLTCLDDIQSLNIHPTIATYNTIILQLCQADFPSPFVSVYQKMKKANVHPNEDTFAHLMLHFAGAKNMVMSEKFFSMMLQTLPPTVSAINILMIGYFNMGDYKSGLLQIPRMKKLGLEPNGDTLCNVVRILCKKKQYNRAFEFVISKAKEKSGIALIPMNVLVKHLCTTIPVNHNLINTSIRLLRIMEENEIATDSITYNIIINALCSNNRYSEAKELVEEMKKKKLALTAFTYGPLLKATCAENYLKSVQLIEEAAVDGVLPTLINCNMVLDQLSKKHKMHEAELFMKKMKREYKLSPDERTFTTIIRGHSELGNFNEVDTKLQEMGHANINLDARTYHILIKAYCAHFKSNKANFLWKEMLGRHITPETRTVELYVLFLAKQEEHKQILSIVKDIKGGVIRVPFSDHLKDIIKCNIN